MNTINNVPRELLERCAQYTPTLEKQEDRARALSELRALLSAPLPAGVDGLEVVAYTGNGLIPIGLYAFDQLKWHRDGRGNYDTPLCRLSDAQAIIDGVRGELGAAVEMLAQQGRRNTELRKLRDQLAGLLRESEAELADWRRSFPDANSMATDRLLGRIETALAELKPY